MAGSSSKAPSVAGEDELDAVLHAPSADLKLACAGGTLHVHRCILAMSSEVFRGMIDAMGKEEESLKVRKALLLQSLQSRVQKPKPRC